MKKAFIATLYFICLFVEIFSQYNQQISWPSLADSPWPIIKGDAQATGRSKFVGPSTNNVLWIKDMPHGIIYGPIIGYDDILFFGTASISSDSNYFYALKPDGTGLWTFRTETGYPNYGSAIIGKDSSIYFPSNNSYVYAVDKNGKEKWKTCLLSIGLKPVLSMSKNGDIYVSTWADSLVVLSSEDGLIKFKKYIGENLNANQFTFSVEGDKLFYVRSEPGTSGRYVGSTDLNGNKLWEKSFTYLSSGMPVIDNQNNIYLIGSSDEVISALFSLDAEGELRWIYNDFNGSGRYHVPSIDGTGNIILSALKIINSEQKQLVYSISNSGELNWKYVVDNLLNWENTEIDSYITVDADGKIYFGATNEGYFYCLSADGELLWKLFLEGNDFDSSPAIGSDGTLYIGSHSGSLDRNQTNTLIAIKEHPNSVEDEETPTEFNLEQNYPNPFNPTTIIKYAVVETSRRGGTVSLRVYDMLGREVATLVNETKPVGTYEVEFDGSKLTSGVYFYVLQCGDIRISKKMLLLR